MSEERIKKILSKDGTETGEFTGSTRSCQMESCRGTRRMVRWLDGTVTWPCTRGLKQDRDPATGEDVERIM